jgi:hypothetical protein
MKLNRQGKHNTITHNLLIYKQLIWYRKGTLIIAPRAYFSQDLLFDRQDVSRENVTQPIVKAPPHIANGREPSLARKG